MAKIVELADKTISLALPGGKGLKDADRSAHEADQIKNGSVIQRGVATPIMVQRDSSLLVPWMAEGKPLETDGTAEGNRKADQGVIKVYRAPAQPKVRNKPSTARLAPPAQPVQAEPPAQRVQPQAPAPEPEYEEPEPEYAPPRASRRAPKTKVILTGAGMAKTTVYFQEVFISPTLVVLGYSDDGESAVIEPPPAGADDPITLLISGRTYTCMSGEFSFQRDEMTFLVLVLVDPPA